MFYFLTYDNTTMTYAHHSCETTAYASPNSVSTHRSTLFIDANFNPNRIKVHLIHSG